MSGQEQPEARTERQELYNAAAAAHGAALDRLAAGYESDPARRLDLLQEIHLQLWRSLGRFDGRCSLATWTFRVAHNTATSFIRRERRSNSGVVSLEKIEAMAASDTEVPDIDRQRVLLLLTNLIRELEPLDRQIMICYLEEMETAAISEVTGLSKGNVAVRVHRIKNTLSARLLEHQSHVGTSERR